MCDLTANALALFDLHELDSIPSRERSLAKLLTTSDYSTSRERKVGHEAGAGFAKRQRKLERTIHPSGGQSHRLSLAFRDRMLHLRCLGPWHLSSPRELEACCAHEKKKKIMLMLAF